MKIKVSLLLSIIFIINTSNASESQKLRQEYKGYYNWLNELLSPDYMYSKNKSNSEKKCLKEIKKIRSKMQKNGINFYGLKDELKTMAKYTKKLSNTPFHKIDTYSPSTRYSCKNATTRQRFRREKCTKNQPDPAIALYCKCRKEIFIDKGYSLTNKAYLLSTGLGTDETSLLGEIVNKTRVDGCISDARKGEEVADKAFDLNEKYSVCKSEQDYLKRKMKSDYSPKKMVLSEESDFPNLKKMQETRANYIKLIENADNTCLRKNEDTKYIESFAFDKLPPKSSASSFCKKTYEKHKEADVFDTLNSLEKEDRLLGEDKTNDIWITDIVFEPNSESAITPFYDRETKQKKKGFFKNKYKDWRRRKRKYQDLNDIRRSPAFQQVAVACDLGSYNEEFSVGSATLYKMCEEYKGYFANRLTVPKVCQGVAFDTRAADEIDITQDYGIDIGDFDSGANQ